MAKILIADDDREFRELIVFALRFAGHEVISATNGADACNLARVNLPDLILLDVRMPKMNGYDACQAIKNEKSTSAIPVIFLSVKGQEAEVQAGLKSGADGYLLKPISPDQLTERVRQFLQKMGK